ncbi:MAG: phosphatase PAP2 family protein [Clostridia bacterium]|nr:phosphatase PAP2 family protein [Clostridia bacterium]MBQ9507658.1 phosphatase PAP2 family protein [Clostridia bacterium]MBR5422943.1 phosphatase PAP2 family protein [Clostridia bacterium]
MTFQDLVPLEQMSAIAQWLNNTFGSMDQAILTFYHNMHEALGTPMDIFVQFFTKLGDGGIFLILLSLFLMLFKKSRKVGIGMLGGIIIGALFTNIAIKNIVARPRPYNYLQIYRDWFQSIWHWGFESEFSFPSGHTTAAMASMTPVFLFCNKKKSWLAFLFVIVLGATRNYIMVHFPSDILGGIIVGGIAGLLSFIIVNAVYDKLCKTGKFGQTLENADIRNLFKKKA